MTVTLSHFIARVLILPDTYDQDTVARRCRSSSRCTQFGFTLIELLVVFSILALLLTLATPRYLKTVDNGKDKVQAQNMATLRDALDKFRADQGRYPVQLEEVVAKQYLRQIPLDPVSNTRDWVLVPPPNGQESGIYDIKAPDSPGLSMQAEAGLQQQRGVTAESQLESSAGSKRVGTLPPLTTSPVTSDAALVLPSENTR
jgi:general secretion pathway protein G